MALVNLEGVSKPSVEADWFETVLELSAKIADGKRYFTTAASEGAINIWLDDFGEWHCETQRYCRVVKSIKTKHISAVKTWAKGWIKKIK